MSKRWITFLLMIPLLLCSITVKAEEEKDRNWADEIIYFIMIDRFNNGDTKNDYEVDINDPKAYHGGDFKGIIDKLDYIKSMGFTAIWLTPIVKNEPKGYHGYWTEDFYDVEEHFGTLEEFKELVQEAHQRNIKVILDLVVNHTGYDHPWLSNPDKRDWFHEAKEIGNWDNQDEVEEGQLFGLPDLAQENPAVKEYLLNMAKWWIEETDIDGYRLDTVKHVPKWFWEEFSREVKSVKEDFFLIGEVWHNDSTYVADYAETGIDSFVDYSFYNEASRIFSKPNQTLGRFLHGVWKRNTTLYENPNILGNFIDNHDNKRFTRIALENEQDPSTRLKQALTYMYTAPGIPIIYYGTEIALDGADDPDNRRLMEFTDHELVNHITKLSEIRKDHDALRKGDYDILFDQGGMTVFKRTFEDEVIVVAINNTTESQEVNLSEESFLINEQLFAVLGHNGNSEGNTIKLDKDMSEVYILKEVERNMTYLFFTPLIAFILLLIYFLYNRRKR